MSITQSFIFAAGRGERMRPITDSIPKPLVKINNKAIIDYTIEKLNKISSIQKIIINGFYLAEQISDHIKNLNNTKIIFSHEPFKIETGGGLAYAKNKIDMNHPILLINGDILWEENGFSDIENLYRAYLENECELILGLKKTGSILGYEGSGDFDLNKQNGEISRSQNKFCSHVFVGTQIINPKIINRVSETVFSMNYFYKNPTIFKIKGFELSGKYFHIGNVESIAKTAKSISQSQ